MTEQFHSFQFKANYFLLGNTKDPERVWIVCHGYGQLASRFIKKFKDLDQSKNLIIAPEGTSHFYLKGLHGDVGSSWMTKHNRLIEIENQFEFLESLVSGILEKLKPKRVTLLGFSQGGATICRWVAKTKTKFDDLILWSTIFPPDMEISFAKETLTGKKVKLFYGDKDPLIKELHLDTAKVYLKEIPQLEIINFKGDHRVVPKVLLENLD